MFFKEPLVSLKSVSSWLMLKNWLIRASKPVGGSNATECQLPLNYNQDSWKVFIQKRLKSWNLFFFWCVLTPHPSSAPPPPRCWWTDVRQCSMVMSAPPDLWDFWTSSWVFHWTSPFPSTVHSVQAQSFVWSPRAPWSQIEFASWSKTWI